MASSSSLPRSGNAMVSLTRVRACIFWKCIHSFGRGIALICRGKMCG